jgi:hypothetical protein
VDLQHDKQFADHLTDSVCSWMLLGGDEPMAISICFDTCPSNGEMYCRDTLDGLMFIESGCIDLPDE